ncbi:putative mannitol dehydrogenase [Phytophthora cinnamomi]|uniref:putative mannitol dehydrogenase n=1 Tax=Phytophthora cinnamomi TaxID=4785 RepID=UPI00355ABF24|nr:putative mannitol dehydrogenase [Phytophthora cinnamomi]
MNKDPAAPCKECATGDGATASAKVGTYNSTYKNDGANSYGGYADYVRVTPRVHFQDPGQPPVGRGRCYCAPGTTVFTPLKEADVKPGKRVGVVGIGGLGHLGIQFAKAMGADAVVAFLRSANKEDEVRALGATEFVVYTRTRSRPLLRRSVDVLLICANADNACTRCS